jgi:small subunit ribosomal protein S1
VHISEISWITKEPDPFTVANIGDAVEVIILDLDEERLRISLSIKQCLNHPYEAFVERHAIGDNVIGNITNIVDYGLFVVLEGGINGLVHISQISWEVEGEAALCDYNKGDEVSTVILSLNSETKRIGLGIKQQENDPRSDHIVSSDPGSKVKAIEDIKEVKGGVE